MWSNKPLKGQVISWIPNSLGARFWIQGKRDNTIQVNSLLVENQMRSNSRWIAGMKVFSLQGCYYITFLPSPTKLDFGHLGPVQRRPHMRSLFKVSIYSRKSCFLCTPINLINVQTQLGQYHFMCQLPRGPGKRTQCSTWNLWVVPHMSVC